MRKLKEVTTLTMSLPSSMPIMLWQLLRLKTVKFLRGTVLKRPREFSTSVQNALPLPPLTCTNSLVKQRLNVSLPFVIKHLTVKALACPAELAVNFCCNCLRKTSRRNLWLITINEKPSHLVNSCHSGGEAGTNDLE